MKPVIPIFHTKMTERWYYWFRSLRSLKQTVRSPFSESEGGRPCLDDKVCMTTFLKKWDERFIKMEFVLWRTPWLPRSFRATEAVSREQSEHGGPPEASQITAKDTRQWIISTIYINHRAMT